MTYLVEHVLFDARLYVQLVFQHSLHTRQRSIAATLAQSVHRHVQSLRSVCHGAEAVAHGKIVVVMSVEVEV